MKKYIPVAMLLLCAGMLAAQDATSVAATLPAKDNSTLYLLTAIMAVLLLAIVILGKVFISLTKIVVSRQKEVVSVLAFITLFSMGLFAQEAAPATLPVSSSGSIFNFDITIVTGTIVLLAEIGTVFFLLFHINKLLNVLSPKPEKEWNFHLPKALDNFNKSVSIEQEGDIMLDHDYDGIKELDNDLPPWWKYGFYITIVWAVVYLFYYHLGGSGTLSHGEYNKEMELATLAKEEFMRNAKNNVDENTIVFDKELLADGSKLFTGNCATCHGNAGEGNVGPNLTDEYWLHNGGIKDIFKSIKYGWPNKGMKAWEPDFTPVQIQALASYIYSIRGTGPANAKAPQGDKYSGEGTEGMLKDSAVVSQPMVTDSMVVQAGK
jgi:cytochrome c oxidase cbb3-type subunit 3